MVFIVNGERWCSLIEAVKRNSKLVDCGTHQRYFDILTMQISNDITYEVGTRADIKYQETLSAYCFGHMPWNGALYNEWSR